MPEEEIGTVTHYYTKIGVGMVKLSKGVKVGDTVHFKGTTTDFTQTVESMQVNRVQVTEANPGDEAAIKLGNPVRTHDRVTLVTP